MNEIVMALLTISINMTGLNPPDSPPTIYMVSQEEVQSKACGEKECKDLHFFTDPSTNIIYADKNVDYKFTFAKAELLHEITRYTLTANKIYNPHAPCSRNVKLEMALDDIEFDYIKEEVKNGSYVGKGLPEHKDIPPHVFYCTPDAPPVPDTQV